MPFVRRIFADGRIMGAGLFSDAIVIDLGPACQVKFSGIAAVDPDSKVVVGYESHNGAFAADALERQVADIFRQAERLMEAVSGELGRTVTLSDLTEAIVFLREDYPLIFDRFNDAYVDEFRKRGIGQYPTRTTVMKVTLPEPNALVEIQFEAMVKV